MTNHFHPSEFAMIDVLHDSKYVKTTHCITTENGKTRHFIVNRIKDSGLIKYYLANIHNLGSFMPLADYFISENHLFIIFQTSWPIKPIQSVSNAALKKQILRSALANVAYADNVSGFFNATFIASHNIGITANEQLAFYGILDRQNPEQYESFSYLQHQVSSLVESLFPNLSEDPGLLAFSNQCEHDEFEDVGALFRGYQKALEADASNSEPYLYELLYKVYCFLGKHSKALIVLVICLAGVYYFYQNISTEETPEAYQKTQIGLVTYEDPYQPANSDTKTYQISAIAQETPVIPEVPEPTIEPSYTIYIVPAGDYLNKIAVENYGDKKYTQPLATYNHLDNPDLLPIQFPLKLPDISILDELLTSQ